MKSKALPDSTKSKASPVVSPDDDNWTDWEGDIAQCLPYAFQLIADLTALDRGIETEELLRALLVKGLRELHAETFRRAGERLERDAHLAFL